MSLRNIEPPIFRLHQKRPGLVDFDLQFRVSLELFVTAEMTFKALTIASLFSLLGFIRALFGPFSSLLRLGSDSGFLGRAVGHDCCGGWDFLFISTITTSTAWATSRLLSNVPADRTATTISTALKLFLRSLRSSSFAGLIRC